jgi:hypothetical protein
MIKQVQQDAWSRPVQPLPAAAGADALLAGS